MQRRLEREREKLPQAHYADAIPLDVLKRQQGRISRELRGMDETGLLSVSVRYLPPFDGVLGGRGEAPHLSEEGAEVRVGDGPETPRDDDVTSSRQSDVVVSASEATILRGLLDDGVTATKSSKNKQIPTPWGFHDVGSSVDPMVGVAGFEPTISCSQSRRATKLRYTPLERGRPPPVADRGDRLVHRAGDGNRTRAICLEGRGSTIELHPR